MATSRQVDLTFDLAYPTEHYKFLQRLGERRSTDIVVQIYNKGIPYNISGTILGFEMRNDRNKVVIDKEQSRFTKVTPLQGVFSYKPPEEVQSFYGNAYLAYFTLENGADRVTTERFRFYNDEDVQACIAPDLQEHYVSVIDDLVASNASAMDKANEIKDLIEANQVVKKAGDIMSGNLLMENPNGAISTRYFAGAPTGSGAQVGWESLTDGTFRMYDWKNNRNVLSYNPATDYITLNRKHPYLVTTGGSMSGDLRMEHGKILRFLNKGNTATIASLGVDNNDKWYSWSDVAGKGIFSYDPASNLFNMNADTNLVKKAGDTMTGPLVLSGALSRLEIGDTAGSIRIHQPTDTTTSARGIQYYEGGNTLAGIGRIRNGGSTDQLYMGWGANPWDVNTSLTVSNTQFTYKNKPVAMRDQDGRATLTLTADAVTFDGGFGPIADRRGNSVTIRMAVKRNVGSTGEVVTTLPSNMRPLLTLVKWGIAEDGTPVKYQINTDGTIRFYQTGKDLRLVETYVVD